ncbi:MAG TPA: SufD family Fe-S cluster assembly protein, partial [Thermoanaerobaculia bacterium]|nr:SufD family Fe-S cluster assembly protein [Thermoanaerobaculia bacterium]
MSTTAVQDALQQRREQAAQRFEQLGWPTTQQEAWQYTSLAPLQKWRSSRTPRASAANVPAVDEADGFRYCGRAIAELVFVDGVFRPEACTLGPVAGVRIDTFRNADGSLLEEHFARYADYQNHPFTALNTAMAQDGAVITIDDAVEGFIHLLFIGSEGAETHPRNLIVAGRGSQISIVETYLGTGTYFTNAVTEIVAREGAVIDHTKLECESFDAFHIGTIQVHQERSSSVTARTISLGGRLVRNET